MNPSHTKKRKSALKSTGWWMLLIAFALTTATYWPGLKGGFLFDDYPNIVNNKGVQPPDASMSSLTAAALSSPSSEFKRPLASLSFAANYLTTGIDPYWMKLTNLVIHLLNGLLVFLLCKALLQQASESGLAAMERNASAGRASQRAAIDDGQGISYMAATDISTKNDAHASEDPRTRAGVIAALVAAAWMLLPINLTGVLYVVQRMESMANAFVLLGLLGYVAGRRHMLAATTSAPGTRGFWLCAMSIATCTGVGVLAKETAVMLPLYALLVEWALFQFQTQQGGRDNRLIGLFLVVLALPMVVGLAWLLPQVFSPAYWSTRDFNLQTRVLSEARIVTSYIRWTLWPTPDALSFYHDDFHISLGLLTPWSTLTSIGLLIALVVLTVWSRRRRPLVALGIALFLGCHLLTGTILPLELIYEHRNYFASFGLLLAVIPLLGAPRMQAFALPRHVVLAGLMLCWLGLTAFTAYAWGNPLRLAVDLASRAPQSSRAQYELGRTYIVYSHYDPASPFTKLAYAPLEKAATLPGSSILPEQALIFMNARMHLPIKAAWWDSMISKLKARRAGVQDESSLDALTKCAYKGDCELPSDRMVAAFLAALSHPSPSARLQAIYGDYAWNVLKDRELGLRMEIAASKAAPGEPAYLISLIKMSVEQGNRTEAQAALSRLKALNIGGRLDQSLAELHSLPGLK